VGATQYHGCRTHAASDQLSRIQATHPDLLAVVRDASLARSIALLPERIGCRALEEVERRHALAGVLGEVRGVIDAATADLLAV
jgi:hypothetical protein